MIIRKQHAFLALLFAALALVPACVKAPADHPNPLTFQRGQQLLAAGSPKSAIPLLTQTITSMPDGPEPVALLSLAYALDLQHERALVQASQVKRTNGSRPGWECVAIAIAQMNEHHPAAAVATLQQLLVTEPANSPLAQSANQWLTLALVLNHQPDKALELLGPQTLNPQMQTTALLWTALLHSQQNRKDLATDALVACAKLSAIDSGTRALQSDLAAADGQTRYDAALAALAGRDPATALKLLEIVQTASPLESDAPVWVALLNAITKDWQTARTNLKDACEKGSPDSAGLANQFFALVCALEDRPDDMIQSILSGQRLLGRNSTPAYIVDQPKPEPVWFSDAMK